MTVILLVPLKTGGCVLPFLLLLPPAGWDVNTVVSHLRASPRGDDLEMSRQQGERFWAHNVSEPPDKPWA